MQKLHFWNLSDRKVAQTIDRPLPRPRRVLGGNLHAPDEWVDLESVREVTKVLALTAIDWCG